MADRRPELLRLDLDDDLAREVLVLQREAYAVEVALLDELDRRHPANPMIVSTGSVNVPALGLYRRRGFHPVRRREAAPGLLITELAKPAARG